MPDNTTPTLDLEDIQGFILRGYHMKAVRHHVLRISDVDAARKLLAKSVNGDPNTPQVTTATPWTAGKPEYCLNIGLTYAGLSQLTDTEGVNFPGENFADKDRSVYKAGAAAAASWNGDTGESAPENWVGGLGTNDAQVIYSLYTMEESDLEKQSSILKKAFAENSAFELLHVFDGRAFPEDKIHFGYRDGIAQPQIEGGPAKVLKDDQLSVQSWQFVLQDVDRSIPGNNDCTYTLKTEKEKALLINGSFAAFRVLRQDVASFDKYLKDNAETIDPETLAAKMCGRWRNGDPLVLDPDGETDVPPDQINNFEYKKADPKGERCPFSSHIRRSNPRNERIRGSRNGEGVRNHRIIRRGMPYGPQYTPGAVNEDVERGLLGMFICADLANQFEFIMHDWLLSSGFAGGIPEGKDPLLGDNNENDSLFNIPRKNEPTLQMKGFPRFIDTSGGAYLLLPSLTSLRHITDLESK